VTLQARAQAAALGQARALALACSVTGYALADVARYAESAAMYRACLQLAWSQAEWRAWCYALYNLPRTLAHQRRPQAAAQLLGYAQAFFTQRFGPFGAEDLPVARRTQRLVAAQLGRDAAQRLAQEGARMTQSAAMQLALEQTAQAQAAAPGRTG
jgi:hypothetical protein